MNEIKLFEQARDLWRIFHKQRRNAIYNHWRGWHNEQRTRLILLCHKTYKRMDRRWKKTPADYGG